MAYHPLKLPNMILSEYETLIRHQLEPFLVDVHSMLRLPIADDPGLLGGCNFSAAQVLLSVVSGASVMLYRPNAASQGGTGEAFKDFLVDCYPWDCERSIVGAKLDRPAAEDLYYIFRNPLVHVLGMVDAKYNPAGRKLILWKGSTPEEDIEALELADVRPTDWEGPTLDDNGQELKLWVRGFYWGVRKSIERVAARHVALSNVRLRLLPCNSLETRST